MLQDDTPYNNYNNNIIAQLCLGKKGFDKFVGQIL